MRFLSTRDYSTILKINKELINDVVDITAVIFKLNQKETKTNSYGEGSKKSWMSGVEVPGLFQRGRTNPSIQLQTVDVNQDGMFSFLRQELSERNIYPEQGDVIYWDKQYYEIHNTNETQLWGGRTEYHHSISCEVHLTRYTSLQIEMPLL